MLDELMAFFKKKRLSSGHDKVDLFNARKS